MRRFRLWIGLAVLGGLVSTGVAVADLGGSASVKGLSATTFSATAAAPEVRTVACRGGGTFQVTSATYTGTLSIAELSISSSTATIRTREVVDTTTGNGTVSGRIIVGDGSGRKLNGTLQGVITSKTVWNGFIRARSHNPGGRVLANFSATLADKTLSLSLGAGAGSPLNSGVLVDGCEPVKAKDNGKDKDKEKEKGKGKDKDKEEGGDS